MKTIFRQFCTLIIAVSLAVSSCTNVDELSDANTIGGLTLLSYSPNTIKLASVTVENDVIYIPVLHGKYEFPLRFYATIDILPGNKVIGIDLTKEQCLESIDSEIKFFVMAPSGSTRTYYIRAKEIPLDENNYISENVFLSNVAPEKLIVSQQAVISARGDTLTLFSVGGEYPVTVTPTFNIVESSKMPNFDNGSTPLRFTSASNIHKLKVVSKSGAERVWNVRLHTTSVISASNPDVQRSKLATTDIEPRTFISTAQGDAATVSSYVDNYSEVIELEVKKASINAPDSDVFPLKVDMSFDMLPDIELFGMQTSSTLTFNDVNTTYSFDMLDKHSGVSRHWTVKLKMWKASSADVLTFPYNATIAQVPTSWSWGKYYYEPCIKVYSNETKIFPLDREIHISASAVKLEMTGTKNKKAWKLSLDVSGMTLSPGAVTTTKKLEWVSNYEPGFLGELGSKENDCWKHPKEFVVRAQDGTEATWKVVIANKDDNIPASTKCDLLNFSVARVLPNYAKIDAFGTEVDNSAKTIKIKLLEDAGCYPISIYPDYEISPLANVLPMAGQPLVFESVEDVKQFTITAQDGKSVQNWNVSLIPAPLDASAGITDFKMTSLVPSEFDVERMVKDDESRTIELLMSKAGAFPLTMGYVMTVSNRAVANVPLRGEFVFDSFTDIKVVRVTAQDGSSKDWKIKLIYMIQLPNWDLNKWLNTETATPWASANNSFVKGTNRTTDANGGYAAQLKSQSAPIVNTFAAGSLFTGWFDIDNAIKYYQNDPVILTHFGIEFATSSKLVAVEADISYHAGNGPSSDYASAMVQLIYFDKSSGKKFEFHGDRPDGTPHPNNNAVEVAKGYAIIGNSGGTVNNTPVTVVPDGAWTKIRVPVVYPNGVVPKFTHLNVCFSSSWEGARFKGAVNSLFRVDNVKLIYED